MPELEYIDPRQKPVEYRVRSRINAGLYPEVILQLEGRDYIMDGNAARRIGSMLLFAAGSIQADTACVRALLAMGITEEDRDSLLASLNDQRQKIVEHDEHSMVRDGPKVTRERTDREVAQAEIEWERLNREAREQGDSSE